MKRKNIPQGKFGFGKNKFLHQDESSWNLHTIESASKHKQVKPGMKHRIQIRKTP